MSQAARRVHARRVAAFCGRCDLSKRCRGTPTLDYLPWRISATRLWCRPVSAAMSRVERPAFRARSKPSRRAALALSRWLCAFSKADWRRRRSARAFFSAALTIAPAYEPARHLRSRTSTRRRSANRECDQNVTTMPRNALESPGSARSVTRPVSRASGSTKGKGRHLPALLPMRPTRIELATFGLKDRRSLVPVKGPLTTELRAPCSITLSA